MLVTSDLGLPVRLYEVRQESTRFLQEWTPTNLGQKASQALVRFEACGRGRGVRRAELLHEVIEEGRFAICGCKV